MERRTFIAAAMVAAMGVPANAAKIEDVPKYLQEISVTVRAKGAEGSGIAFVRDGVTWVWTAAHVVDGLRKTRTVVDGKGGKKTLVEFDDAQVVRILLENGRIVGRLSIDARVVRYSDATHGHDLALLRVRKKGFIPTTCRFFLVDQLPKVGSDLWHCGSLLGSPGAGSVTRGTMSQLGRIIGGSKVIYDQCTVTAFPGSSGGAVTMADGRIVGMLVRGTSVQGFNLIVPVRRWRKWAKSAGVLWAMDPAVKMPPSAVLDAMPIESAGGNKSASPPNGKRFPVLIRRD